MTEHEKKLRDATQELINIFTDYTAVRSNITLDDCALVQKAWDKALEEYRFAVWCEARDDAS